MLLQNGILSQYGSLPAIAVFFGFFAVALVALMLRDRKHIRPLFGLFIVTLILGSSLTAIQPIPVINANEYTVISPEQYTHYDLRVVDADGDELPYDPRAMRPNLQNEELAENLGKKRTGSNKTEIAYTRAERRQISGFLLEEAREYRHDVKTGSYPRSVFTFPPHHVRGHWSASDLSNTSEFVGIRVYRMDVTFRNRGREAVVNDEELVYEFREGDTDS
jgi:hypothetical protein